MANKDKTTKSPKKNASKRGGARLWRLGAAAKVSKTYNGRLDATDSRALDMNAEDRNSLTILTYGMMTRAQLIAENAVHGCFSKPSKKIITFV